MCTHEKERDLKQQHSNRLFCSIEKETTMLSNIHDNSESGDITEYSATFVFVF
jgi:hypothetical protein